MKDLIKKVKWILSKSKNILPFLVFTIVINTIFEVNKFLDSKKDIYNYKGGE